MKTLIASIIVLTSTVVSVVLLSSATTATAENILGLADRIEYNADVENTSLCLSEIERIWKDGKGIFALTVWHTESGLIDSTLAEMRASLDTGDRSEFSRSLARLSVILTELIESEHLSFIRIF